MGKISDALERHKKEQLILIEELGDDTLPPLSNEDLQLEKPVSLKTQDLEVKIARQISTRGKFSESLVMISSPDSPDAENFRILRGQILFPRDHQVPRSILVTSTFPSEGKSFVASNLAVAIAMSVDQYVLLIDADMRRGMIHRMFGIKNVLGLRDYLKGGKGVDELIVKTGVQKLSILPAGTMARNPAELITSNMMARFLAEAKERHKNDFIIIDSPPTQITAEVKFLVQFVDAVLFVVMANKTPKRDAQKAMEGLGGDKILGVVFNGYDQPRKHYYKYYDKYYKKRR
jgi:protein-tyrosine kinase